MDLNKNQIESIDKVGLYKGEEVYHIKTKGGYNLMALKKSSGRLDLISYGSHRAIAKHMADMKYGDGIQWNEEALYKAETAISPEESNKEAHMALADHHAKLHNKYREMSKDPTKHAEEVNSYYRSFAPDHKDMSHFNLSHDIHMQGLRHEDLAIKHYGMSGLDRMQAYERLKSQVDHSIPLSARAPFDDDRLHRAWNLKNQGQKAPSGLGFDWTK